MVNLLFIMIVILLRMDVFVGVALLMKIDKFMMKLVVVIVGKWKI